MSLGRMLEAKSSSSSVAISVLFQAKSTLNQTKMGLCHFSTFIFSSLLSYAADLKNKTSFLLTGSSPGHLFGAKRSNWRNTNAE